LGITGTNALANQLSRSSTLQVLAILRPVSISGLPKRVGLVSFEAQSRTDCQRAEKKTTQDIMDVISLGTPVMKYFDRCQNPRTCSKTGWKFGLSKLLDRRIRKLSTGETRKVHADTKRCQQNRTYSSSTTF